MESRPSDTVHVLFSIAYHYSSSCSFQDPQSSSPRTQYPNDAQGNRTLEYHPNGCFMKFSHNNIIYCWGIGDTRIFTFSLYERQPNYEN